jgi:ribonuclease HII
MPAAPLPGWGAEDEARSSGLDPVAGVDEVGRGCLAGPVVAAAVILDRLRPIEGVDDSKRLLPAKRRELAEVIRVRAIAWAVGEVEAVEIDRINILRATQRASALAIERLSVQPAFLLLDAIRLPLVPLPQRPIVHGDRISVSIAAASILAKVHRDALMSRHEEAWPGYGFDRHKGYGTAEHLQALIQRGPCPLHRRSFRGVFPPSGGPLFEGLRKIDPGP